MKIKELIAKIHLWLGLLVAPIVFFVCITGTILVFSDEIIDFGAGDARYVSEVKSEKIPTEVILQNIKETYPKRRIPSYMVVYKNPERSVRFNSYAPGEGLRMLYVDPYTGEILKDDPTIHFFYTTAHLHNSFMWHGVGEWIVDISVIIFVVLLLSGLVLWWPKNLRKKQAYTVNWKANKKRLNHDLHNVLGFYSLGLALILSITGLIIAFKPLAHTTVNAFGGDADAPWEKTLPQYDEEQTADFPINAMADQTFQKFPDKDQLQIYTFYLKDKGVIPVKATKSVHIKSTRTLDYVVYDRYTGEEVDITDQGRLTEKIENTIWILHMGTWGLLGKIITFLVGLILSSMPVTGFYIWWHKHQKQKANQQRMKEALKF